MRDLKYFDEGLGFVEFRENLNLNYFDEGLIWKVLEFS